MHSLYFKNEKGSLFGVKTVSCGQWTALSQAGQVVMRDFPGAIIGGELPCLTDYTAHSPGCVFICFG